MLVFGAVSLQTSRSSFHPELSTPDINVPESFTLRLPVEVNLKYTHGDPSSFFKDSHLPFSPVDYTHRSGDYHLLNCTRGIQVLLEYDSHHPKQQLDPFPQTQTHGHNNIMGIPLISIPSSELASPAVWAQEGLVKGKLVVDIYYIMIITVMI